MDRCCLQRINSFNSDRLGTTGKASNCKNFKLLTVSKKIPKHPFSGFSLDNGVSHEETI